MEGCRFHRVRVLRTLPHPGRGFTQGLIADGTAVWESVGQYGESALRRYELGAPAPAAQAELPAEFFAEGICRVGATIWQLTWRERVALSWDAATLESRERIRFNREGWGMCAVPATGEGGKGGSGGQRDAGTGTAATEIVTSDGTSELVRRDPQTLEPRAVVHVRCAGHRVRWLNDLAWSGGLVWANVAGTAYLAGIDLETGEVTDVVDAHAAAERHWRDPQAIMNGIAALAAPGEFLLTGKNWRKIRHVTLVRDRDRGHVRHLIAGPRRMVDR